MRMQRPSGAPAEELDEYDPHHLPAEQRTTHRESARHTTAPATTTAPPETPATTLRYLTIYGEELPILTSRPPPGRPWPKSERAPREIAGPQAGPSSTALDGVCVDASAPPGNTFCSKGSSGTCSACKGHRPCIRAGATKRVLLTREYSLHCCIRGQMHKGCRGVLRPARRNCRQTVRCKV